MALIASQVYREMHQALGSQGSSRLSRQDVANDMGEILCSMRSWKWKERRMVYLDLRGTLTLSDGNLTGGSGLVLTPDASDPYASYVHSYGDLIQFTGGTGITAQRIPVTGTSGSGPVSLTLASSPAAGDLANADITATLRLDTVALPAGVKQVISIDTSDNSLRSVEFTSKQHLTRARSDDPYADGATGFLVAFSHPEDGSGVPFPLLEIWPAPENDVKEGLIAWCKFDWTRLTSDASNVGIPTWLYPLYKEMCREAWLGKHEHEGGDVQTRLARLMTGPLLSNAVRRDASEQPEYGALQHGHAEASGRSTTLFNNDTLMGGPV